MRRELNSLDRNYITLYTIKKENSILVYIYADCNSSKRPLIGFCHATKAVKAHLTSAVGRYENLRGQIVIQAF